MYVPPWLDKLRWFQGAGMKSMAIPIMFKLIKMTLSSSPEIYYLKVNP
jgi:hypothetical protein